MNLARITRIVRVEGRGAWITLKPVAKPELVFRASEEFGYELNLAIGSRVETLIPFTHLVIRLRNNSLIGELFASQNGIQISTMCSLMDGLVIVTKLGLRIFVSPEVILTS